jgi:gamma-glutamyltranspeptidase/glutathione hydrolase
VPDEVRVEHGFAEDSLSALRARGHLIVEPLGQSSVNSIMVTANGMLGAPDPRTRGAAAAGQ